MHTISPLVFHSNYNWATVCKTVRPMLLSVLSVTLIFYGQSGWMDQDETWHEGRPRPRPHCTRWGPSPRIFGRCLLWPNGWMDATWYGGTPRPQPHCVRWRPSPPPKGHSPILGPRLLWKTPRRIKKPLGTKVGLGPGHNVLDGDPAPPKGAQPAPIFGPRLLCWALVMVAICNRADHYIFILFLLLYGRPME